MKVVIIRGPSGVGKSTYVEENYPGARVCSADKFFKRTDGEYAFDANLLPQAHSWCMSLFLIALNEDPRPGVVVVDNTFTERWEWTPYRLAGDLAGAEVEVVEILPRTIEGMRECAARNAHGTPAHVVAKMVMAFEPWETATQLWMEDLTDIFL